MSKYIAMDKRTRRDTAMSIEYLEKKDEYQEITAYLVASEPGSPKEGEFTARDQAEARGLPRRIESRVLHGFRRQ